MKRILYLILVILCVSCHKQGETPVGKTLSVALYPHLQNMDEAKREAAILLANLLCGREFLDRYISNGGSPLFYIPARQSVSCMLEKAHPVYRTLDSLASAPSAVILYGDPDFL